MQCLYYLLKMNLLLNLLKWDLQSDFTLKSVFKVKSIFIILCKICEKFDFFFKLAKTVIKFDLNNKSFIVRKFQ
jgi:hypothetical protein